MLHQALGLAKALLGAVLSASFRVRLSSLSFRKKGSAPVLNRVANSEISLHLALNQDQIRSRDTDDEN